MTQDMGASDRSDRATQASPQAPAGLGHSVSIPSAGPIYSQFVEGGDVVHIRKWSFNAFEGATAYYAQEAGDILFEALKQVNGWLASVADTDMDEIVADGGITAAMAVRQEAGHQQRKVRNAIAEHIARRMGATFVPFDASGPEIKP